MTVSAGTNGHSVELARSIEASTPSRRRAEALHELQLLSLLNGGGLLPPATVERWFERWPDLAYLRAEYLSLDTEVG